MYILSYSRRKRGEKGEVVETIEDVIVRRLTAERIEELKKLLRETQEQYRYVYLLSENCGITSAAEYLCINLNRYFIHYMLS